MGDWDIFRAAILGIVQGITEFIPVSSSGHLLLTRYVFGWPDEGLAFDAVIHLGTFFAVLFFFWDRWKAMVIGQERSKLILIALATIPAAIAGFFLEDIVADVLRGRGAVTFGFAVTAILMTAAEVRIRISRGSFADGIVRLPQALSMGILQVVALLPGVSRSGSTMSGGIFAGAARAEAVVFSFLMSLPITAGAGTKALIDSMGEGDIDGTVLVTGFVLAFVAGLAAIRIMLRYIRSHTLLPFAAYVGVLAVLGVLGVW